jgi:hypothetical protein
MFYNGIFYTMAMVTEIEKKKATGQQEVWKDSQCRRTGFVWAWKVMGTSNAISGGRGDMEQFQGSKMKQSVLQHQVAQFAGDTMSWEESEGSDT